jgi:hypothetical protein
MGKSGHLFVVAFDAFFCRQLPVGGKREPAQPVLEEVMTGGAAF